jgi:hypothetical protein
MHTSKLKINLDIYNVKHKTAIVTARDTVKPIYSSRNKPGTPIPISNSIIKNVYTMQCKKLLSKSKTQEKKKNKENEPIEVRLLKKGKMVREKILKQTKQREEEIKSMVKSQYSSNKSIYANSKYLKSSNQGNKMIDPMTCIQRQSRNSTYRTQLSNY